MRLATGTTSPIEIEAFQRQLKSQADVGQGLPALIGKLTSEAPQQILQTMQGLVSLIADTQ